MVHDRVTIDPNIMFGKPVIKGTRITIELILRKMSAGMTDAQIVEHHPQLQAEDLRAAAAFAAKHRLAPQEGPENVDYRQSRARSVLAE